MDLNDLPSRYTPGNLSFPSDSDSEQDFTSTIHTFIQVQYLQNYFPQLSPSDQSFILHAFPPAFSSFLSHSFLLHKSQLSIVLLGLRENLLTFNSSHDNLDPSQMKEKSPSKNLCVVKKILCPNAQISLEISKPKTENDRLSNTDRNIMKKYQENKFKDTYKGNCFEEEKDLRVQPFLGFSLSSLMAYFGNQFEISLPCVGKIFAQLVKQVKFLHDKQTIHGDISPNNILLSTNKNQPLLKNIPPQSSLPQAISPENNNFQNLSSVEDEKGYSKNSINFKSKDSIQVIRNQLSSMLSTLVDTIFQQNQVTQKSNAFDQVRATLIDFQNSWTQIKPQQGSVKQTFPTQAINYRSPEALDKRGSYPADIWGLGHVLFTLFTGQHLFPLDNQLTSEDLEEIFSDQQQFATHVENLCQLRHPTKHHQQINSKILKTIKNCLNINPNQRPTVKEIEMDWAQI